MNITLGLRALTLLAYVAASTAVIVARTDVLNLIVTINQF